MGLTIYIWFSRALSVVSDVATGATAGWLAQRRGGAHGATADLIGSAMSLVGSIAIGYARMGEAGFLALPSYWITTLAWLAVGVVLAAVSGAIAVGLRQRRA
jgi:heme exporter protein D